MSVSGRSFKPMNRVRLGAFDVLEEIANGGMGDVWRGIHRAQGIPVAIKVLRPSRANQQGFKALFRREVRAIAQLMLELGQVTSAWESLREAQQIFEDAGHFIPWMESQLGMARVVSRLGDYGHAVVLCRRVLAFARRDGLSRIEASACAALAEVQLEHGDRVDAEASFDRGIQLFEQLGFTHQALSAGASRILLLLESGKWSRAAMRADELTGVPEIEVSRVSRLLMSCIRLALAVDGPRAPFDQCIDQVAAGLAEVEWPTPDMARCLRVAGERAAGGRKPRRQARITELHAKMVDRVNRAASSASGQEAG